MPPTPRCAQALVVVCSCSPSSCLVLHAAQELVMMHVMCKRAASRWLQSLVPNSLLQVAAVSRCSATAVVAIVATPVRAHLFGLTLVQPVGDAVHGAGVCVCVFVCVCVYLCVYACLM